MQRYSAVTPQPGSNGFAGSDNALENCQDDSVADDGEVQRFRLAVPMREWISFLPAEAAEAYVLERSRVSKDRLAIETQDAWSRGSRLFVPRVTKECRQYLKRALAEHTGLPCRIGLTGRCHLKPPFSRKKRAPLFVTNGFCGRKDHKCLRFKFTVQDFDPQEPEVLVDVEVRGQLLTGPDGEDRHSRRPADELEPESVGAGGVAGAGAAKRGAAVVDSDTQAKRRKGRPSAKRASTASADVYAEAVQALEAETWPTDFDLQSAEVVLDDGQGQGQGGDQSQTGEKGPTQADFVADEAAVNTIQVMSDAPGDTALGEDAARELVQLANEALSLAGDGTQNTQFKATKIVQSGDQVFIFVSDPDELQNGAPPTIEAVEVTHEEMAAAECPVGEVLPDAISGNILTQYEAQGGQPEPEHDEDSPCMEYRWAMQIAMADWLRLLPPKSLRYYIHERTVGREVWVEEGWEKQFRCQTLQHGWRDVVRRAVVEQTDIPCQVCFRGRSSLKLPFSRKHSAALWRTQGYCAKGDRNCLIYKFCVQDFHPDDENVTVQVTAVGKLHRDCRRWFNGVGTPVPEPDSEPVAKGWGELEAELTQADGRADRHQQQALLREVKREPEQDADEWEPEHEQEMEPEMELEPERASDSEQEHAREPDAAARPDHKLYQSALKSLETLKASLAAARRCPPRLQAVLRLIRGAEAAAAAPCGTETCACRPQRAAPVKADPESDPEPGEADGVEGGGDDGAEHDLEAAVEAEPEAEPEAERPVSANSARPPSATSPPPLAAIVAPPPPAAPRSALTAASTTSWQTKVTRSGPVVVTAVTPKRFASPTGSATPPGQPTIIKLTPAQMAAGVRLRPSAPAPAAAPAAASASPRTSTKLVKLSTAIERSAMPTSAVITPARRATAAVRALGTPKASVTPPGQQGRATSLEESLEDGADPSWIMDEMRSVIMGVEDSGEVEAEGDSKGKESPAAAAAVGTGGAKEGLVVTEVRSLRAKPTPTAQASTATTSAGASRRSRPLSPPSRPVTRALGTKVAVSAATSSDPPPLVPISKGGAAAAAKTQPTQPAQPAQTAQPTKPAATGKGSRFLVIESSPDAAKGKPVTPASTAAQLAKTPTRTVQTRLLTSVLADKSPFRGASGGKVLILKPSSPMLQLRSSTRKPS